MQVQSNTTRLKPEFSDNDGYDVIGDEIGPANTDVVGAETSAPVLYTNCSKEERVTICSYKGDERSQEMGSYENGGDREDVENDGKEDKNDGDENEEHKGGIYLSHAESGRRRTFAVS